MRRSNGFVLAWGAALIAVAGIGGARVGGALSRRFGDSDAGPTAATLAQAFNSVLLAGVGVFVATMIISAYARERGATVAMTAAALAYVFPVTPYLFVTAPSDYSALEPLWDVAFVAVLFAPAAAAGAGAGAVLMRFRQRRQTTRARPRLDRP